jgi:hypothetical protein
MKSGTMLKVLVVGVVSSLSLMTGTARADGCLSPGLSASPALLVSPYERGESSPLVNAVDARLAHEMARIELGLRTGQLTPYQAGRLMRMAWELSQFQRGFVSAAREPNSGQSCALNPDVVGTLAPLVGNMAKGGLETASSIMRALADEANRLLQEKERHDALPPL